jgi:hypothetical protein
VCVLISNKSIRTARKHDSSRAEQREISKLF